MTEQYAPMPDQPIDEPMETLPPDQLDLVRGYKLTHNELMRYRLSGELPERAERFMKARLQHQLSKAPYFPGPDGENFKPSLNKLENRAEVSLEKIKEENLPTSKIETKSAAAEKADLQPHELIEYLVELMQQTKTDDTDAAHELRKLLGELRSKRTKNGKNVVPTKATDYPTGFLEQLAVATLPATVARLEQLIPNEKIEREPYWNFADESLYLGWLIDLLKKNPKIRQSAEENGLNLTELGERYFKAMCSDQYYRVGDMSHGTMECFAEVFEALYVPTADGKVLAKVPPGMVYWLKGVYRECLAPYEDPNNEPNEIGLLEDRFWKLAQVTGIPIADIRQSGDAMRGKYLPTHR